MTATRSIDENAIADVNIYLYSSKKNYHFYYAENAPSFELQVLPGEYTLCVITNMHKDMGLMSNSLLIQQKYYIEKMQNDIPMTASMKVRILGAMTLPAIEVTRIAAKITYSIAVDDAVASAIKLRSVQFCNAPSMTVMFGTGSSSTNKTYYYDDVVVDIYNDKIYTGDYYMLDNCQGEVNSITDPKDKSPENAPECATYMRILADGVSRPEKGLQ